MRRLIDRFASDETGATAIEYGLIVAILSLALIASLTNLRDAFGTVVNNVVTGLRQS